MIMTTDKAYLLGLVIGGGVWGNAEDVVRIVLPYRAWGYSEKNLQRASSISKDVMRVVSPMFREIYGLNISYEMTSGQWVILCEGDTSTLEKDLSSLGISPTGEIRKTANISNLVKLLVDTNLKKRFIAGLADTIGSTKETHRRFSDDRQIISFEINGFNFSFVCELCQLLSSIGCYADQILWNHPNFHTPSDPFYTGSWSKGFKIRVLLDQYQTFGSFAFTAKATSAKENLKKESQPVEAISCKEKQIKQPSVSVIHPAESSPNIPENIRGCHFLHYYHVCAALGCPNAPYQEVDKLLKNAQHYISPFPILTKKTKAEIEVIINSHPLFKNRKYTEQEFSISSIFGQYSSKFKFLFQIDYETGYPLNKIISAIAFLIAAKTGNLNGNRPRGSQDKIITDYIAQHPSATIKIYKPDLLTPIILELDSHAALVGPDNPKVYSKLISFDPDNKYKMHVRNITEMDLL